MTFTSMNALVQLSQSGKIYPVLEKESEMPSALCCRGTKMPLEKQKIQFENRFFLKKKIPQFFKAL